MTEAKAQRGQGYESPNGQISLLSFWKKLPAQREAKRWVLVRIVFDYRKYGRASWRHMIRSQCDRDDR